MPRHPLSTTVRFKRLHPEATLPAYAHEGDSGMDLRACIPDDARKIGIPPGESRLVDCGFSMQLDEGYEGQVRPRSGLAAKHDVTVTNTPGTVDSTYRGPVKVLLRNEGKTTFVVDHGARIAQLVIQAVPRVSIMEVEELDGSARGEGGFGSTGMS